MDIHGISFDVCPWYIRGVSVDIPRFLNPDFSAGPCCWSHSMRTQVWVMKSVKVIPRATMAIVPGEKVAHKRLTSSFSPPAAPCPSLHRRPPSQRRSRWVASRPLVLVTLPRCCVVASTVAAVSSGGGGDGGGAGFSPGGVAFNDFSFLVSVGADCAGPSRLVRSETYSRTCWRSVGHLSSDMDSRSYIALS
jgi:hypothetical protein